MRCLGLWTFLAVFGVCGVARAQATTPTNGAAAAPATTVVAPEQHPPDKLQWDGLPIVATDSAAFASLAIAVASPSTAAGTVPVGLGLFVLGGPTVHAVHGQWGAMGLSLVARVVIPLVGDGISVSTTCNEGDCAKEAVRGIFIGMIIASLVDLSALSWERVPNPAQPSVQPLMSVGKEHAWFGASGRF